MVAPQPLAQLRKLSEQAIGTFALHPLDQSTDGDVRWDGEHDMDMIWGDMSLADIDARLLTCLPDNGMHPLGHFTIQHLVAILSDSDNMEVDRTRGMGAMTIVTHAPQSTQNLLELPLKAGILSLPSGDNKVKRNYETGNRDARSFTE